MHRYVIIIIAHSLHYRCRVQEFWLTMQCGLPKDHPIISPPSLIGSHIAPFTNQSSLSICCTSERGGKGEGRREGGEERGGSKLGLFPRSQCLNSSLSCTYQGHNNTSVGQGRTYSDQLIMKHGERKRNTLEVRRWFLRQLAAWCTIERLVDASA